MTLFSNFTNFGTIALLILGLTVFALLCPWRNLPTNLDTLLKSLWRLSGPVAVTWAVFVVVLIGTTAYAILLLVQHLGTVGTNTDHLRQIILAIPVLIAALAALIALPVTLIRLHYTRRQTLAEEEGLITDRINAAVLGLGAEKTVKVTEDGQAVERTKPNIEVRIGAILALERIAQKNLDVHIQIMEILCEYLRNNCFWMPTVRLESDKNPTVENLISPRADIQRALKVLGTKSPEQKAFEIANKYRMSLSNCNFCKCNFRGLNFIGSIFTTCNFFNVDAFDTNFQGAKFEHCEFDYINISRADLTGAQLEDVNWNHAASRITTLPNSVRGLIVIKSELNAVLSLPRGQKNFIYSTYDTLWGASEGSKAANDLRKLMHGGALIDEETERKIRFEAQTKFQLKFFSRHPSSDLLTPYEIDAFRRAIGHLGFPYTDE